MQKSLEILKRLKVIPLLRLAYKDGNRVIGTGPHKVKLVSDKLVKRINPRTAKEEYAIEYIVEENGQQFKYLVPIYNKQGEVHYLLQRLGSLPEGTEVILEYKKKEGSYQGYIDVQVVSAQKEIEDTLPTISYESQVNTNPAPSSDTSNEPDVETYETNPEEYEEFSEDITEF